MPDDGNRICLNATAGCEKIEITDQHGNQIVLDAAKEKIKLYAPTNNTYMELGKTSKDGHGFYVKTDADYKIDAANKYTKDIKGDSVTTVKGSYSTEVDGTYSTDVVGSYTTLVGGFYTTVVGGAYTTVAGGFYTNVALVGKAEVCLGAKAQVTAGFKLVVDEGWKCTIGKMKELNKKSERIDIVEGYLDVIGNKVSTFAKLMVQMEAGVAIKLKAPFYIVNDGVFVVKG